MGDGFSVRSALVYDCICESRIKYQHDNPAILKSYIYYPLTAVASAFVDNKSGSLSSADTRGLPVTKPSEFNVILVR